MGKWGENSDDSEDMDRRTPQIGRYVCRYSSVSFRYVITRLLYFIYNNANLNTFFTQILMLASSASQTFNSLQLSKKHLNPKRSKEKLKS